MKKATVLLLCFGLLIAQGRGIDRGTVVVVYDGDTIKVKFDSGCERRVRLIGIDTPEIEGTSSETALEANLSKRFTFHHLFRKTVELAYEREREDKYGRLLAYVWTEKGLFNEFILEEGFARVFLKFPYALKDNFVQAQRRAQQQGRGFWREDPHPRISVEHVLDHIGKLIRVSFVCTRIRKSRDFVYVSPEAENFAVLIPEENLPFFGNVQKMKGKAIEVFGFLEEYKGQPQILLFFPSQLEN